MLRQAAQESRSSDSHWRFEIAWEAHFSFQNSFFSCRFMSHYLTPNSVSESKPGFVSLAVQLLGHSRDVTCEFYNCLSSLSWTTTIITCVLVYTKFRSENGHLNSVCDISWEINVLIEILAGIIWWHRKGVTWLDRTRQQGTQCGSGCRCADEGEHGELQAWECFAEWVWTKEFARNRTLKKSPAQCTLQEDLCPVLTLYRPQLRP